MSSREPDFAGAPAKVPIAKFRPGGLSVFFAAETGLTERLIQDQLLDSTTSWF